MELEILLGAIVFFVAQIYKKLDTQYGTEASKNMLLIIAFLFSIILAGFTELYNGTFEATTVQGLLIFASQIFTKAIVIYQIAYKRILLPVLNYRNSVV